MKRNRTIMPLVGEDFGTDWQHYPPLPFYEVSREGYVRVAKDTLRKGSQPGRLSRSHWRFTRFLVCLTDGARRWEEPLALMVARTHLPAPPHEDAEVYHLDGNPENCAAGNLDWMTPDMLIPPSLLQEGEIVRPTEGLPGYCITSRGRAWSAKRRLFLSPDAPQDGHVHVNVIRSDRTSHASVPKLVATAFPEIVGARPFRGAPLAYRDGDMRNCAADNLYWTSHEQVQTQRVRRSKTRREAKKETATEEADVPRAECPDAIRFLLSHYSGKLPARESVKNQHYYYVDGRYRVLCATCATRIANSQANRLDRIDADFPVDCRVLWPSRSVTCRACERTIEVIEHL